MFRKHISTWAVLLLILVALGAVAVAGCGGSTSASSSSAPTAAAAATTMSADQIVAQSEAKMKDVKSASFIGDMALKVSGDPSKMTDPTSKAMLSQGISLHMEGKSQNQPVASDMKISLGLGGQTLDLSLLSQGTKSWVEYQGKWYAMDAKSAKSLSTQAQAGAAPTEQLKSLGLNPSDWGTSYSLVGTEDLAGAKVYHVKATADPQKLADALMKAAKDPSLAKKLGGTSQLKQLEQGLSQNGQQVQQLKKSLKNVSVDYWIGVDDMLIHKASFNAVVDTKGQKGMTGINGMTMGMELTMADFGQPVTVTAPATALPLKSLLNQMFGGLTTGSASSLGI
jgi:hypothetical protein